MSINFLIELLCSNQNSSMIHFSLGILYLFKSLSRKNNNKERSLLLSYNFLKKYAVIRRNMDYKEILEVEYNFGRYFNFIGLDGKAESSYCNNLNLLSGVKSNKEDGDIKRIKLYSIYNSAIISKNNGNFKKAHDKIINNIII